MQLFCTRIPIFTQVLWNVTHYLCFADMKMGVLHNSDPFHQRSNVRVQVRISLRIHKFYLLSCAPGKHRGCGRIFPVTFLAVCRQLFYQRITQSNFLVWLYFMQSLQRKKAAQMVQKAYKKFSSSMTLPSLRVLFPCSGQTSPWNLIQNSECD